MNWLGLVITTGSLFSFIACTKSPPTAAYSAWPNPKLSAENIGKKPTIAVGSTSPELSSVSKFVAGVASGGIVGCSANPAATSSYSCASGEVAVGNNLCCPSSTPYLCGSPSACYSKPCGTSSGGSSSGGSGCTAGVCCGGLYECNGLCYASCVVGSQPCCTELECVCYTPCC